MFAASFPSDIKQNADRINKSGGLDMGKDFNTFGRIFNRVKYGGPRLSITNEIFNVIVNIQFKIMFNFQVIIVNYFAPMMVVVIQMLGYYHKVESQVK